MNKDISKESERAQKIIDLIIDHAVAEENSLRKSYREDMISKINGE